MFRGIHALIFDFDGTLVDASRAIVHSFNHALVQFGAPALPPGDIRAMIGRPLREMLRRALPDIGDADIDQLVQYYREAFAPVACTQSQPIPGLETMLAHFQPRCALGIATSRMSDGAQQILGHLGCLSAFSVIVGLQDVTNPKPHPESICKAMQALGALPQASIMIGDVPDDMRAAKAAGTAAIGIASTLYGPDQLAAAGADAVIQQLDELIDLVTE